MEIFNIPLRAVFPIFTYMLIGFVLRRIKILDVQSIKKMNKIAFTVFLSAKLFASTFGAQLNDVFQVKLGIYIGLGIVALFFITFPFVKHFEKEDRNRSVLIQSIFRGNFAIYGIEIADAIYGRSAIELVSGMTIISVGLFNILGVAAFEIFHEGRVTPGKVLLQIIKTPLIIAIISGLTCNLISLNIPQVVNGTISSLGNIATPLLFLLLGGSLQFDDIKKYSKKIITVSTLRMIVVPAILIAIAIMLGFRNEQIMVVLAVFGTPMAIASFTMAENLGGNAELAGSLIAATSVASLGTLFVWISVLMLTGFM